MTLQDYIEESASDAMAASPAAPAPKRKFMPRQELGKVDISHKRIGEPAMRSLYKGAAHTGCGDLGQYCGAILTIALNEPVATRCTHQRLFTGLSKKELATVARYRRWLDGVHRQLNGRPFNLDKEREMAKRVGVTLNELIREGLSRLAAEFETMGGINFGARRAAR